MSSHIIQAELQIAPSELFKCICAVLNDVPFTSSLTVNFTGKQLRSALCRDLRKAGYHVNIVRASGAIRVLPAAAGPIRNPQSGFRNSR